METKPDLPSQLSFDESSICGPSPLENPSLLKLISLENNSSTFPFNLLIYTTANSSSNPQEEFELALDLAQGQGLQYGDTVVEALFDWIMGLREANHHYRRKNEREIMQLCNDHGG